MAKKNKNFLQEKGLKCTHDVRCQCGSLVARLVKLGIELKCRRCKRLALIPFTAIQEE